MIQATEEHLCCASARKSAHRGHGFLAEMLPDRGLCRAVMWTSLSRDLLREESTKVENDKRNRGYLKTDMNYVAQCSCRYKRV